MPAVQTRDFVTIAGRPVLHSTAQRDFVCRCGSRLRTVCDAGGWQTVCAANPAHSPAAFMPSTLFERIRARQADQAPDVLAHLPARLRASITSQKGKTDMPIKHLTNQPVSFPEIGRLHKGGKKTDPKRPGPDLTYFRMANISDDDDVETAFAAVYGPEPRIVNVLLPFRTVDENWDAWQEEYVAGGLVHRCDGETMVRWRLPNGDYSNEPRPCPYATGDKVRTAERPGCVPEGRLRIVIPELKRLAYVTVSTHSKNDIAHLDSQLRALPARDLRGIPLILYRRPYKISTPETYPKDHPQAGQRTGRRVRRVKWLLSIEASPTWTALLFDAQQLAALPGASDRLALPSGAIVDGATGEIVSPEEELPGDWSDEEEIEEEESRETTPPPAPAPAPKPVPGNGKCPVCQATGDKHAPWCQDPAGDGRRFDARPKTNGKAAVVKAAGWSAAATALAASCPYYQNPDGSPNFYRMTGGALKHARVEIITDANLSDVISALRAHAADEAELKAASEPASLVDADGNLIPVDDLPPL